MQAWMRLVFEPWNGPAQSTTSLKPASSSGRTEPRSISRTRHPPSSAASASSGFRRRPASVSRTPGSAAVSRARREPNTPLAPTISTSARASCDIFEQHFLMQQLARPGVGELELEQEARPGDLAMNHPRRPGRQEARQAKPHRPELKEIMVADEGDAVGQRLDPKRHAEPAAEIFLEPGR